MWKKNIIYVLVLTGIFLFFDNAFASETAIDVVKKGIKVGMAENLDQAIAEFNKAIEMDPKLAMAYENRAYVYFMQGNYDQSIRDYSKALALEPANADHNYKRGVSI